MPVRVKFLFNAGVVGFGLALVRRARPTPSEAMLRPAIGPHVSVIRKPVGARFAAAEKLRIRSLVICGLANVSVTGLPVSSNACSTCVTVAVGAIWRAIAQAPATCGVAIEVPSNSSKLPPPGPVPGAPRS